MIIHLSEFGVALVTFTIFRTQDKLSRLELYEIGQVTESFLKEIEDLFFFVTLWVLASSCSFSFTGVAFAPLPLWGPT